MYSIQYTHYYFGMISDSIHSPANMYIHTSFNTNQTLIFNLIHLSTSRQMNF